MKLSEIRQKVIDSLKKATVSWTRCMPDEDCDSQYYIEWSDGVQTSYDIWSDAKAVLLKHGEFPVWKQYSLNKPADFEQLQDTIIDKESTKLNLKEIPMGYKITAESYHSFGFTKEEAEKMFEFGNELVLQRRTQKISNALTALGVRDEKDNKTLTDIIKKHLDKYELDDSITKAVAALNPCTVSFQHDLESGWYRVEWNDGTYSEYAIWNAMKDAIIKRNERPEWQGDVQYKPDDLDRIYHNAKETDAILKQLKLR